MSLLIAGKAPDPKVLAQAVFTCSTTGCKAKPSKPCVYSSGSSRGKVRKEGSHAGRLTAAAELLAAFKAGVV